MQEASVKAILCAFIANFCIALAKTRGARFTGSGSLLAEAIQERAAQQSIDFRVREPGYRTDSMNELPKRVFGGRVFNRRLEMGIGLRQMSEARGGWDPVAV